MRFVHTRMCLAALAALAPSARAADIYVDCRRGADTASGGRGAALKTIARAIRLAKPGDMIHLDPAAGPYRESVEFINRSGAPGKPITLDGHGATITGAEPIDVSQWRQVGPGLYRCDTLYQRTSHGKHLKDADINAVIMRYFLLFDGRMQRMGRTSKGPKARFKKPEDLAPGEWTFVRDGLVFYIRIDPAKTLADCRIEAPLRSNGVAIYGKLCEHITIRNLTATHVYNDGFNIHGKTRRIRFENVRAIECGDDGASAHDDCRITLDGFVSIGNSTGMCHTGASQSVSDRVLIRGCHGVDLYLLDTGSHVIRNSIISCNAAQSIVVAGRPKEDQPCTLSMENVLVEATRAGQVFKARRGSIVEITQATLQGLSVSAAGRAFTLRRSIVGGAAKPYIMVYPRTKWLAERNAYDLQYLRMDKTFYTAKDFDAYRRATGQDADSSWQAQPQAPARSAGVGVDMSSLPPR